MTILPPTPFTQIIQKAGAENYSSFDFNGYQFADIVQDPVSDVSAGRLGVAMQDVSPMMKFMIEGKDAGVFLDYISTRKLSHLKPGRVAYFLMVNEDGFVRDDGTAYCFSENEFMVQSVSKLAGWMNSHKQGFDVTISEVQSDWAEISIYGLKSAAYLESAGIEGLDTLKPFNFRWINYEDTRMMVSRTGFSGGLGYELMIPWDDAERILGSVLEKAGSDQVTFTGNYTGTTLRLDIGFLIPGWDFPVPGGDHKALPSDYRTPYDLGWDWLVQLDNRPDFIGKDALTKVMELGPRFEFLAAVIDEKINSNDLVAGAILNEKREEIGRVFIAGYSSTISKTVGFCNIVAGAGKAGDAIFAGDGSAMGTLAAFPLIAIPERSLTPPPGT